MKNKSSRASARASRKPTRDATKPSGLPKDSDRATFRMLTGVNDPHYALHTMTSSLRSPPRSTVSADSEKEGKMEDAVDQEAVEEKYFKGGWAKEDDPIYKQGWTIAPNMAGRRRMIGRR